MNKEQIKKANLKDTMQKTIETAKTSVRKANEYALNSTEEIVTETITIASQWQQVTDKALKGGIKLIDNQQNLVFDALETYKSHLVNGKKRLHKIFAA